MPDRVSTPPTSSGVSSGFASVPAEIGAEIARYVADSIARYGASGRTFVENDEVIFLPPSGRVSVPLGVWAHRWNELDDATRRLRTAEVARQLAQPRALRAAQSVPPPRGFPWLVIVAVATLVLALAFLVFSGRIVPDGAPAAVATTTDISSSSVNRRGPSGPPLTAPGERPLDEHRARAARVCEATRTRVVRGATVAVTDADGWVVEFRGVRDGSKEPLTKNSRLTQFFETPSAPQGSRFIWKEEANLAPVETSDTLVVVQDDGVTGSGASTAGIVITFAGALVEPYFDAEQRLRYFHLAHALSDALGTTQAALYARCAEGRTHHLGSWFRGRNEAEAASALLYFLGTYAEPPHLAPELLRGPDGTKLDRTVALDAVEKATAPVDRSLLAALLGRHGGMVMGKPGEPATITFPFRDGNRASRASRELARVTNVGVPD